MATEKKIDVTDEERLLLELLECEPIWAFPGKRAHDLAPSLERRGLVSTDRHSLTYREGAAVWLTITDLGRKVVGL